MSFFKDCDIRGKTGEGPDKLNKENVFKLGRVLGTIINADGYTYSSNIVVGGDIRLSTPSLKTSLIEGLIKSGADVIDIGTCSTPYFYYAIENLSCENGIMVTASHNPKEFNGFKFVLGPLPVLKEDIEKIEEIYNLGKFIDKKGKLEQKDLKNHYIKNVKGFFDFKYTGKVIVDFSNGTNSFYFEQIAAEYVKNIEYLNQKPDGNFPGHVPNPAISENLVQISQKIRESGSDIGIAFDSDGDRVIFLDSHGDMVNNDKMLIIIASHLLKSQRKFPIEKVVNETKSSAIVQEALERVKVETISEKTGHTYIKRRVITEDAICGGEITGHYFYRFLNGRDDGIITALMVLDILNREGKNIKKIADGIPSYYITEDIRIHFGDKERNEIFSLVLEDIKKKGSKVDLTDGIKMFTTDNSWALLRISISEPLLSLRFEVKDKNKLTELIDYFLESVPGLKSRVLEKIY
ncbi:phosphomannomutase/phosphoglucomutase [Actinomycetota bacterium]